MVALDEPMDAETLTEPPEGDGSEAAPRPGKLESVAGMLEDARRSLLAGGTTQSANVEGRVAATKFSDDMAGTAPRARLQTRGEIAVEKELSPDFLLVAKHPVIFTALLDALAPRFCVYAVIRNPLALLSSWQTVPLRVRDGHTIAERVDPKLRATLETTPDRIERQLHILEWFFGRYRDHLPESRIIRYEAIVDSGGKALSAITERAAALDEPLESRNRGDVYDHATMRALGERLLGTDGPYWSFYSRESVEELVQAR